MRRWRSSSVSLPEELSLPVKSGAEDFFEEDALPEVVDLGAEDADLELEFDAEAELFDCLDFLCLWLSFCVDVDVEPDEEDEDSGLRLTTIPVLR